MIWFIFHFSEFWYLIFFFYQSFNPPSLRGEAIIMVCLCKLFFVYACINMVMCLVSFFVLFSFSKIYTFNLKKIMPSIGDLTLAGPRL